MKAHRHIGNYCCQLFAHDCVVFSLAYFFTQCAFDFICMGEHVFQCIIFLQQLGRSFFSNTCNAGDIVYGISHEPKHIHYLLNTLDIPFFTNFFSCENFF